mmetsp:Transcript_6703/g.15035  ORF Transcript_6703/g.15035 Transcript_6703/m.15035 type:complete len:151 (+) Transcript_6703:549-1001(+)
MLQRFPDGAKSTWTWGWLPADAPAPGSPSAPVASNVKSMLRIESGRSFPRIPLLCDPAAPLPRAPPERITPPARSETNARHRARGIVPVASCSLVAREAASSAESLVGVGMEVVHSTLQLSPGRTELEPQRGIVQLRPQNVEADAPHVLQ